MISPSAAEKAPTTHGDDDDDSSSSSKMTAQCAQCLRSFEPSKLSKFVNCAHVGCEECQRKGGLCRGCQTCAICLDLIKVEERAHLDCCDHKFCRPCIHSWCEKSSACPSCHKEIRKITAPQGVEAVKRRQFKGPDNIGFGLHAGFGHIVLPTDYEDAYEYDGWLVPDNDDEGGDSEEDSDNDDDGDDDDDENVYVDGDDNALGPMEAARGRALMTLSHIFDSTSHLHTIGGGHDEDDNNNGHSGDDDSEPYFGSAASESDSSDGVADAPATRTRSRSSSNSNVPLATITTTTTTTRRLRRTRATSSFASSSGGAARSSVPSMDLFFQVAARNQLAFLIATTMGNDLAAARSRSRSSSIRNPHRFFSSSTPAAATTAAPAAARPAAAPKRTRRRGQRSGPKRRRRSGAAASSSSTSAASSALPHIDFDESDDDDDGDDDYDNE